MTRRPADNPFRSGRVEALRYRGVDPREILARVDQHGGRGALVGPHGTGKTTLLLEVAARLTDPVVITLTVEAPGLRREALSVGPTADLLLDGAEQLSWADHWRLRVATRTARRVILTSHRDTWLPTVWRHQVDTALVEGLVAELVGPSREASRPAVARLLEAHHGNVREVFRALYDDWATRDEATG